MSDRAQLITTLKRQLKAQGKTYADVATWLELSEASVKRLFAEQNFTLIRLERICQMLNLDFSELVQLMNREALRVTQLTEQQEQQIASDVLLLLIAVCILNGYSFNDIVNEYAISPPQCIQKLVLLDRLKIIELLPNNKIKVLVAKHFSWLPNGPIQRFFQQKVEKDFFNSTFDQENEQLIVANRLLSNASNLKFQQKMSRLVREFDELSQRDAPLPMNEKHGNTVVLAVRQWRYSLFEAYQKDQ